MTQNPKRATPDTRASLFGPEAVARCISCFHELRHSFFLGPEMKETRIQRMKGFFLKALQSTGTSTTAEETPDLVPSTLLIPVYRTSGFSRGTVSLADSRCAYVLSPPHTSSAQS